MAAAKTEAYAALLRGVNVGGKNKLPMQALADVFAGEGCSDVATYIQSGNVVFRASPAVARRLPASIAKAIQARFDLAVSLVLRSAGDLVRVSKENPFLREGAEPDELHVVFLAHEPAAAALASLDPARSPPDRFEARGSEIYLRCPNGYGRSKLTNDYFDRRLATTSTVRNWRTVSKLVELTG